MLSSNYYDILGVPYDATQEQIKTNYKLLLKRVHPDTVDSSAPEIKTWAESYTKLLIDAYQVLSEPELRKQYDQNGGTTIYNDTNNVLPAVIAIYFDRPPSPIILQGTIECLRLVLDNFDDRIKKIDIHYTPENSWITNVYVTNDVRQTIIHLSIDTDQLRIGRIYTGNISVTLNDVVVTIPIEFRIKIEDKPKNTDTLFDDVPVVDLGGRIPKVAPPVSTPISIPTPIYSPSYTPYRRRSYKKRRNILSMCLVWLGSLIGSVMLIWFGWKLFSVPPYPPKPQINIAKIFTKLKQSVTHQNHVAQISLKFNRLFESTDLSNKPIMIDCDIGGQKVLSPIGAYVDREITSRVQQLHALRNYTINLDNKWEIIVYPDRYPQPFKKTRTTTNEINRYVVDVRDKKLSLRQDPLIAQFYINYDGSVTKNQSLSTHIIIKELFTFSGSMQHGYTSGRGKHKKNNNIIMPNGTFTISFP